MTKQIILSAIIGTILGAAIMVCTIMVFPAYADEIQLPDGTTEPATCVYHGSTEVCESRIAICTFWERFMHCELKPVKSNI